MAKIEVSFSAFFSIFTYFLSFWPILAQYFDLYSNQIMFWAFFGTKVTPLAILNTPKSCLVALNGLKKAKIDSNWCFIFCIFHHFHLFCAQFGSIFWLELYQYLVLVIFWNQLDIPSHPTYPQKLFCSLSITLKQPKLTLQLHHKWLLFTSF